MNSVQYYLNDQSPPITHAGFVTKDNMKFESKKLGYFVMSRHYCLVCSQKLMAILEQQIIQGELIVKFKFFTNKGDI